MVNDKTIQVDKKIEFKYNSLKRELSNISMSISKYHIIEILVVILLSYVTITTMKHLSQEDNLTLAVIIFWSSAILGIHYIYLLNECIEKQKENLINVNKKIELLKDFSTYLLALRHLKSIDNGENLYPQLRINDSKYVVENYRDKFEPIRVEYEETGNINI